MKMEMVVQSPCIGLIFQSQIWFLFFLILICKLGNVKTVDIAKDMKLEGDDLLFEEAK